MRFIILKNGTEIKAIKMTHEDSFDFEIRRLERLGFSVVCYSLISSSVDVAEKKWVSMQENQENQENQEDQKDQDDKYKITDQERRSLLILNALGSFLIIIGFLFSLFTFSSDFANNINYSSKLLFISFWFVSIVIGVVLVALSSLSKSVLLKTVRDLDL